MLDAKKDTVEFHYPLKHGVPFEAGIHGVNHKKLSEIIINKSCDVASVFIGCQRLLPSLFDNPRYMKQTHCLGASEVEIKARRLAERLHPSPAEVDEIIKKMGMSTRADNYSAGRHADDINAARRTEVIDSIYDAHVKAMYPQVVEEMRRDFKDEWGKKKGLEEAWFKELVTKLYPTPYTEYERVYAMPKPFDFWDRRNPWQQYYFVESGGRIGWVYGGSAGSSQRESHGRWAHVFADLAMKGVEAPTYCYLYTEKNEFVLQKTYEKFRCERADLTGNYPADWRSTKSYFVNRLLSFSENKVTEIRGN